MITTACRKKTERMRRVKKIEEGLFKEGSETEHVNSEWLWE